VTGTGAISLSGQHNCQMRKTSKVVSIWENEYRMIYENTSEKITKETANNS
jgi:hypothetical protein